MSQVTLDLIYQWLVEVFYPAWQSSGSVILERLDRILTVLEYGLYVGVFAFMLWILFSIVRPHFFKC